MSFGILESCSICFSFDDMPQRGKEYTDSIKKMKEDIIKKDILKKIFESIKKDKLLLTEELIRQREQISQLQQNSSDTSLLKEDLIRQRQQISQLQQNSSKIESEIKSLKSKGRMHINPLIIQEHTDSIEKMKKEISFLMNKLSDE